MPSSPVERSLLVMLSILVSNAMLGLLVGLIPALGVRLDKAPLKLMGVGLLFGAVLGVWAQRQWLAIAQAEARRKRRQPEPPRVGAGGTLIGEASVVRYDPTPPPAPKLPAGAMPPPPAPAGVFAPLDDDVKPKQKKGILGISASQLSPALANLVQVGETSRKGPHIEANASLSTLVSLDDEMNADEFLGAFDSIFDDSIFEVSDPDQGEDDDFFKPLEHQAGEDPATDRGLPIYQPGDHPAYEQSGLLLTRFDEDILDPAQLFSDKGSKPTAKPVAPPPPAEVHRPERPTPLLEPAERRRLIGSGDIDKTRVLYGQYQKALRKCGRSPESVTFAMFSQHVERERRRVEEQYNTQRIGMQVRVKSGKPRIIIRPLGVKR